MNKEENFINTLFEKTEESEAIKPQTTEIIKMPMSSIVPNFKNPYKCTFSFLDSLLFLCKRSIK